MVHTNRKTESDFPALHTYIPIYIQPIRQSTYALAFACNAIISQQRRLVKHDFHADKLTRNQRHLRVDVPDQRRQPYSATPPSHQESGHLRLCTVSRPPLHLYIQRRAHLYNAMPWWSVYICHRAHICPYIHSAQLYPSMRLCHHTYMSICIMSIYMYIHTIIVYIYIHIYPYCGEK